VVTLCSAFKMRMVEMHTVELRYSDEWMNEIRRGNDELRNEGRPGRPNRYETDAALHSIMRDDPNASLQIIMDTLSMSISRRRFALICRGLAIPWNLSGRFPTR
jgi:hypothetical protein